MSEVMKAYYEALERLMRTCDEVQKKLQGENEND